MKKVVSVISFSCFLFLGASVQTAQVDLSTFTAWDPPAVTVTATGADFIEDYDYANLYFSDDSFVVPDDAGILSFNYDFALGVNDFDDYFTFEFDYGFELVIDTNIVGGLHTFDLSSYQGQIVSLCWGLNWDGDNDAGTTASVYNIDLADTKRRCRCRPQYC